MEPMFGKRSQPLAYCTRCGAYSRNEGQINKGCGKSQQGKPCRGTMRSALNAGDWVECPSCDTTGRIENGTCDRCAGEGWLLDRKP